MAHLAKIVSEIRSTQFLSDFSAHEMIALFRFDVENESMETCFVEK